MDVKQFLFDSIQFDKIKQAIDAHEMEFGEKPHVVNVPQPDLDIEGVKIHFCRLPNMYTADPKNVLHHRWSKHAEQTLMGIKYE
jgi:hypothetical protein